MAHLLWLACVSSLAAVTFLAKGRSSRADGTEWVGPRHGPGLPTAGRPALCGGCAEADGVRNTALRRPP